MDPRERILNSIKHKEPDILPVDFVSSPKSGIHVRIVYKLS